MTRRERVMAALRGDDVDHAPLSFWLHNFATENSAEGLAAETLRLAHTFDWDFLKPQSRAQCFAEMWGLTFQPSGERATPFRVMRHPVGGPADLLGLKPADPASGALAEQLDALRTIRATLGPDIPIVWTIFAPLMVLPLLMAGGRAQALALLRSDPGAVRRALDVITDTLTTYARACLAAGADGLFYATNVATHELVSEDECRRFQRPFDLRILEEAAHAPFNLLHLCGSGIRLDAFADYPVAAFSWATIPENPSLSEVHRRTGRAVVGGLPAKPTIAAMTAPALCERAHSAMREMKSRWLLVGPDCSINPDTPEALLHAVSAAVRGVSQGGLA